MKDIVDTVEMPDQDGKSPGDLWYGLPIIPTLATHIWNGRSWRPLLTEEGYYKAEITALRAENERLREWNREIALNAREFAAENEKLRAALREIVADSFSVYAIEVARTALGEK